MNNFEEWFYFKRVSKNLEKFKLDALKLKPRNTPPENKLNQLIARLERLVRYF